MKTGNFKGSKLQKLFTLSGLKSWRAVPNKCSKKKDLLRALPDQLLK